MKTILHKVALTGTLVLALSACAPSSTEPSVSENPISTTASPGASATGTPAPTASPESTKTSAPSDGTQDDTSVKKDAQEDNAKGDPDTVPTTPPQVPHDAPAEGPEPVTKEAPAKQTKPAQKTPESATEKLHAAAKSSSEVDRVKQAKEVVINEDGSVTVHAGWVRPATNDTPGADKSRQEAIDLCRDAVKLFRTNTDAPRVVQVLDKEGTLSATNTPKTRPHEECSWV